jgi:hypothetical protein
MIETLIPSKTRRKILGLFYTNIGTNYHLRKIAREVDEEINAVKRELDILEKGVVLHKEKRLNRMIYSINTKYLLFDELLRIFTKENELFKKMLSNHSKLGKVKFAALSLKFAKKSKLKEGEVSLIFVGIVVIPELSAIIAEEEKRRGEEMNFTVMTEEEFSFRKKSGDPFIWTFLKQPKIMIFGEEEDLVK